MTEHHIFVKCAWRLIPFMVLLYLVNFIDRVNVGFAALTMNRDMDFTPTIYGFGAGIFFFSYALFQVPANIMLDRWGARRWISFILVAWGMISAANALVQGPGSFYALRFLLGVAEAGFFPGMIFYLTLWFPQAYRARFVATFMLGQPLAFILGGPLSGFILGLDGFGGLHGWQWLFVVEGLPACLLSLVSLRLLPDRPAAASWLNPEEKRIVAARLSSEESTANRDLWPALRDPRVIALGLVGLGQNCASYGVQLWMPQIVQAMGYSNQATGFIVALPFVASTTAMLICGHSSDKRGERVWHISLPLLIAAAGFLVASLVPFNITVIVALSIALVSLDALYGPFWSFPSTFLTGSAAAGGIALIRTISAMGGFVGPALVGVLREQSGDYSSAMVSLAFGLLLAVLTVLGLGRAITPRKVPVT